MSSREAKTSSFVFPESALAGFNYVQDTEQLLCSHNIISVENALKINQKMQRYLDDFSYELEQLLDTCRQKYDHNVKILSQINRAKAVTNVSKTVYFSGYPFFKNCIGTGPPQSDAYLKRREAGEFFPMDLLQRRTTWLHSDKLELIQGIKQQVTTYLQSMYRQKIRQASDKRRADSLTERFQTEIDELDNLVLKDLLHKAKDTDFRINWLSISMDHLAERHTPNECTGMWYNYLMPTLNRKAWSSDEEDELLNAIAEYGAQNWSEIARYVANRSAYQCFVHYQTTLGENQAQKNVPWTDNEDQRLRDYVEKYRIGNIIPWTKITGMMPNRNRIQVYNRYMFTLDPKIKRTAFTVEEDCILMAAVKEYGTNFREFPSNLLVGRNTRQIRSRYNNVLRHVGKREHWTEEYDMKLVELVEELGTSNWFEVANRIMHHTRTSCRQRYMVIQRFLKKNPNASVSDVPRRKKAFSTNVTTDNWMETMLNNASNSQNFDDVYDINDPTILDDPSAPMKEKPKRKTIIMKANERAFHEYFKYAYNFEWGRRITGAEGLIENIQITCELLHAPLIPMHLPSHNPEHSEFVTLANNTGNIQLDDQLRSQLNELNRDDFRFPISMNTLLGLRGLVIAFENNAKKVKRPKIEKDSNETECGALQLFQDRFHAMFANTAKVANLLDTATESVRLQSRKRKHPTSTVTSRTVTLVETCTTPGRTLEDFSESQPSTSADTTNYYHHYVVEPFEESYTIKYQPYPSDSEGGGTGDEAGYGTQFVVCDPSRFHESTE